MKIYNQNEIPKDFFDKIEFESLESVEKVIFDIRKEGDIAVRKYCEKFGDGKIEDFYVTEEEIENALKTIDNELLEAIKIAIKNVKYFARKQLECINPLECKISESILGHKIIPLEKVGCYIPGGNYPLPSSAVMTIVPAKVAGVKKVFAASPKIKPSTIAAAHLSGADKIMKIGGVQAIAALAYGTQSVEKVDKIVGPGNKFVTAAKKYVYGECGIDFLAGPSEVMIIADDKADVQIVALDLLAQCEHDKDSRGYLICESEKFAKEVEAVAQKILETLSTKEIAKISFEKSFAVIVDNLDFAAEIANKRAPEHLELMFENTSKYADKFTNYGSLFIGAYSGEVLGDYCSGTNHVLPTNQVARYKGGLSVFDFVKIQTFQNISSYDKNPLARCASILAKTEGLNAHELASLQRLKD